MPEPALGRCFLGAGAAPALPAQTTGRRRHRRKRFMGHPLTPAAGRAPLRASELGTAPTSFSKVPSGVLQRRAAWAPRAETQSGKTQGGAHHPPPPRPLVPALLESHPAGRPAPAPQFPGAGSEAAPGARLSAGAQRPLRASRHGSLPPAQAGGTRRHDCASSPREGRSQAPSLLPGCLERGGTDL